MYCYLIKKTIFIIRRTHSIVNYDDKKRRKNVISLKSHLNDFFHFFKEITKIFYKHKKWYIYMRNTRH